MEDFTIRWFGGVVMACVLLILSYLFFLQDDGGYVPIILLFAGLLLALFLVLVAFIGVGESE